MKSRHRTRIASPVALVLACVTLGTSPASARQEPSDTAGTRAALRSAVAMQTRRAVPYLELAAFEAAQRRLDHAERVLRAGLAAAGDDPDSPLLRRGLAELLGSQARWDEALEIPVDAGLEARLRVGAARESRAAGRTREAEEGLRRAIGLDPHLREGWLDLASLLAHGERLQEARSVAERGLEIHEGDPELGLVRAATLQGTEHVEATVAALQGLRAKRPDDVALALSLAGYLSAAGKPTAAIALQDSLLAPPRPPAEVFGFVAGFWLTAGAADSAAVHLERGVRLHPGDAELAALLGLSYEERGDVRAAAQYGAAALVLERHASERSSAWLRLRAARAAATEGTAESDPWSWFHPVAGSAPLPALLLAVDLAASHGDPAQAREMLERAAYRWADQAPFALAEAQVSMLLGDTVTAVAAYRGLAAEGHPRALEALDRMGAGTDLMADPDLLRTSVRTAIGVIARAEEGMAASGTTGVRPFDGATLVEGGDLMTEWRRSGLEVDRQVLEGLLHRMVFDTEWGPAELSRLRGAHPGSLHLAEVDIRLAVREGDAARAVREAEHLLRIQPGRSGHHLLHGMALEASGRPAEAKTSYGRAFELDVRAEEPFRALLRIHRAEDSLAALLDRVRRVRMTAPKDPVALDREVEVLQRLGRLEEARALATTDGGVR